MKKAVAYFQGLQKFIHLWWYGPLFFLCCGVDHFVVFIPVLGMLVSSVFLAPKKWLRLSLWGALGSALGAWSIGWIAQVFGFGLIQAHFPSVMESSIWHWAEAFFSKHGVWVVFFSGISPITQQPAVIIAAIAGTSLAEIGIVLLVAKIIKFCVIGYLASHAPQYLSRFKSVREEIKELDVEPPATKRNYSD